MFDQVQTALTVAIDVIAFIGLFGLPAHAIAMHHINTVRSWGIPQSMPIVEPTPEAVPLVVEVEPVLELVIEPISVKRALQSVGAAARDIQKMSARELREYCRTNKIKGYSKVLKEQGVKGLKLFVQKVLEE
jgi:hypothetical protein